MIVDFDEKDHRYFVDGEIASVSVTELLHRQGLAPDYSGVSKAVLKSAAERGTAIHKDLEDTIMNKNHKPTTTEAKEFKKWCKKHISSAMAEQKIGYNYRGMRIAGTIDFLGIDVDRLTLIIGDHKTTYQVNKEYVEWQVSIYDYMMRKASGTMMNGVPLVWKGAKKFYCFHYDKDGKFKAIELEKISDDEIELLIDCEYRGEKYIPPQLEINPAMVAEIEEMEETYAKMKAETDRQKATIDEVRLRIKEEMQKQGIKSWESPSGKLQITYVEPFEKTTFDSKKLSEQHPEIYKNYLKKTMCGSSIRVKVRDK